MGRIENRVLRCVRKVRVTNCEVLATTYLSAHCCSCQIIGKSEEIFDRLWAAVRAQRTNEEVAGTAVQRHCRQDKHEEGKTAAAVSAAEVVAGSNATQRPVPKSGTGGVLTRRQDQHLTTGSVCYA